MIHPLDGVREKIIRAEAHHRQVEDRDRLHNVPDEAWVIIESLQPYNARGGKRFSHPLYILNKLTSAEKYQILVLTVTCRAHPVFVLNETNSRKQIEGASITEAFFNQSTKGSAYFASS